MTFIPTAYDGRPIVFATMHGKERLARDTFREVIGATITTPPDLNTDQFGTFAGDIPRTLTPQDSARAKARLGMQMAATPRGLASEGSFTAGFGPLVEQAEILLFIDDELGLELIEGTTTIFPLPGGRTITTPAQACSFADSLGFPSQGIILQAVLQGQMTAYKDFSGLDGLAETARMLIRECSSVTVLPDYRAHRSPSRANTIRSLCSRMAHRLAAACPACLTPGFGRVGVEYGLPCSECGTATRVVSADIHGCGKCRYQEKIRRTTPQADPASCDSCNP